MAIVTRDNVRLPLRTAAPLEGTSIVKAEFIHKTYAGTLVWDTDNRKLELVDPETKEVQILLSGRNGGLADNEVRLLDVRAAVRDQGIIPTVGGALSALRTMGIVGNFRADTPGKNTTVVQLEPDLGAAAQAASTRTATVTLFKDAGKYYTKEAWAVPVNAILPSDMNMSPDFRRIGGGAVLVDTDAAPECPEARNWGFPHLFPSE
ncbi:hypothetical protein [Arthrobacter sp. ES1]|uniref:hypothetical protein n=1 Tax=Arthrobacter sp. ES1 TaxID=1897056 RepID=UPI001CFFB6C5|nr:hypothetical protein [Arthrobacter sp. ES1]MCB5280339.1 hypothetical protein [Arthrobacter sp. ES1]